MRFRWPLFLAALASALLAGCAKRTTPADDALRSGTLLLGNAAEPQDLDPQIVAAFTDQRICVALFEGLTAFDERTSAARPGVAERWESSADGLTWTFHLRADARWSNGEPLTADDFVQSFRRMLAPALAAENAYLLYPLKNAEALNTSRLADPAALGATAVDAHTLRLTLERPAPHLPVLAAQPAWYPVNVRVLAKFDGLTRRGTAWTQPGNLVGNGPFTLAEWQPNARLVVAKNPHYWDAAHVALAKIVFFPIENPAAEERAFRAGQLHVTAELPLSKVDAYRRENPAALRTDPLLETFFLRFNTAHPPLDNPKVRLALARAIDRDAIAQGVLRGSRAPATHYTPPDCAGYTARATLTTDADAARRALAEAGFPQGKGFPVLELQARNDEIHTKVAEAIQSMWQHTLGIEVRIAAMEQKTWLQNMLSQNYTISTARWVADFPDPSTFLDAYVTGNGYNMTGWSDTDYDALIRDASRTAAPAARYELYQRAEARLLSAAPIAPVFFGARTYLIHPAVHGWEPATLGLNRYKNVSLAAP